MALTGIFYIPLPAPNSPTAFQHIVDRLIYLYNPRPLGRWSLDHKLFRETASLAASFDNRTPLSNQIRYLQTLTLSHRPGRSFFAISEPPTADGKANGQNDLPVSIRTISSTVSAFEVAERGMGPLWMHRQTLQVMQGAAYEIDEFRIRVGDLRQITPRQQMRGTVVEIEWIGNGEGNDDKEEDLEGGEVLIQAFWENLGMEFGEKQIVREFVTPPGLRRDQLASVRLFVELLRLRGN